MHCAELHPFSIKSHLHCQETHFLLLNKSATYTNVTLMYTSSNLLASAKATFWKTLVTGQREQLLPNRTTIPLQYMFPCINNNAQNVASNLTTSSLTKHSNILCPPLHDNSHTHTRAHARVQWKLITLAGVKGFHTNKYLQKTEGIARSII